MNLLFLLLVCNLQAVDLALKIDSNTFDPETKFHLYSSIGTNSFAECMTVSGTSHYFYLTNVFPTRTRFYIVAESVDGVRSEPSDIVEIKPIVKKPAIRLEHLNGSERFVKHRVIRTTNAPIVDPPIPSTITNHTPRFSVVVPPAMTPVYGTVAPSPL